LACGVPVVCANNSSLPEVAGDAALQITAADTPALAHALHCLAVDEDLRRRAVELGLQQARRFTWEAAAHRLLAVYRRFAV
jgi:glycosyltransferase involved in cell wall biosynthesis